MHTTALASSLLLWLLWSKHCTAANYQECTEQKQGVLIASAKDCTYFIYCDGDNSYDGYCDNNHYFNELEQQCESIGDIDCRASITPQPENFQNTTELLTTTIYLPSTSNSPDTTHSVSTAGRPAVALNITTTELTSTAAPTSSNLCPSVDSANQLVFLANSRSCTDYFVCYHGKAMPMHCSATLHFNALTSKCDHAENVRCMVTDVSARNQCKLHTVDLYAHPSNCNYYYRCQQGYLLLQQCPFFFGWDYKKRACAPLNRAKCFGNKIKRIYF